MDIKIITSNNVSIAIISSDQLLITDTQSALDLIATLWYESGCYRLVLNKKAITEDFFKLSTQLAGDILQKFINYGIKIAIVGDFSGYTSKPLKDLIYESNLGKNTFFVNTDEEAIEKLANVS